MYNDYFLLGSVPSPESNDLTGKKFGRLTVYCYLGSEGNGPIWRCQCDCGVFKIAVQSGLLNGNCKSCGCLAKEYRKKGRRKEKFYALYVRFLDNAKRRPHTVNPDISFQEFLDFTKITECHYCRDAIIWQDHNLNNYAGYNLDRKDSDLGYSVENCVVCCRRCNVAKSNKFSYEEWLMIGQVIREQREILSRC